MAGVVGYVARQTSLSLGTRQGGCVLCCCADEAMGWLVVGSPTSAKESHSISRHNSKCSVAVVWRRNVSKPPCEESTVADAHMVTAMAIILHARIVWVERSRPGIQSMMRNRAQPRWRKARMPRLRQGIGRKLDQNAGRREQPKAGVEKCGPKDGPVFAVMSWW